LDQRDWFSLQELTGRLGSVVWVESALADVTEQWSRIEAHAGAAVLFASTSGHHRWHAQIVRDCLPTSPQLQAEQAVRPPTDGWKNAVEVLASIAEPDATSTRLRALAKIVDPWLDREVGALVDLARPVSDAAMIRWLRFLSIDHHDDGEAVAQMLAARAGEAVGFDGHVLLHSIDLS